MNSSHCIGKIPGDSIRITKICYHILALLEGSALSVMSVSENRFTQDS
jgi:hypothetical protein